MSRRRPRRSTSPATAAEVDPGLQPERTTLSWSRTGLALVTVSAVFLRWVPHYGMWLLLLPLITLVCALAIVVTHGRRTDRGVAGIRAGSLGVRPGGHLALVAVLLALGAAGLGLVLLAP